ncbi:hypothetical protein [Oryzobacter telluris]|uniref:hypothetical protein n=1 Tax=Oryzobacter telluris TaxID=3149179 RepID=UPI00370DA98E
MPGTPPPAAAPARTPVPRRVLLRSGAAVAVGVAGAAGCTTGTRQGSGARTTPSAPAHEVVPRTDGSAGSVDPTRTTDPEGLAAATLTASRTLLERATAVVVTSAAEADITRGTEVARRLGLPLLVDGDGLDAELDRLGTRTVVRVARAASGTPAVPERFGDREVRDGSSDRGLTRLRGLPLRPGAHGATVLVRKGSDMPPVIEATLAAVGGASPVTVTDTDPRIAGATRVALREHPGAAVLGVGPGFADGERLARRVRTARHAKELPGGGLLPFPGRMMVALYGHPGTAALGMLGEQRPDEAAERTTALAAQYAALTDTTVVPAFELIATVASGSKGKDGDYSTPTSVRSLMPWVQAAERSGAYVVLDLQPGRTSFLTQAKAYEELLRRPWVGLALDPEWRLAPTQKHLDQIGSVSVEEVNAVGAWLAGLVREHDLPPKVLTLHQFRSSMIRGRERLDTSLDEVQWLVHADGQGGQGAKQETWSALRRGLPEGVWLGWKNFEDEDTPMLTPRQTLDQVHPTPQFVSYQ